MVESGTRSLKASAADSVAVLERPFAQLYGDQFAFVWRTLRRLGVREALLEDAAQDTFVILYRRISTLRPEASLKAFVFGIGRSA